jgi:DNA-binding MarR family transcriptional regulator
MKTTNATAEDSGSWVRDDRPPTDEGAVAASRRTLDMSYLEGTIGYAIRRAQMAVFHDIFSAFGEDRITPVQFSVLAVVADNPGANQADLAAALGVERPRMVPIIDMLEKAGLAFRAPAAADRRQRQIHLTEQGARRLADLKAHFAGHQQRMIDRLGAREAHRLLQDLWRLTGRT